MAKQRVATKTDVKRLEKAVAQNNKSIETNKKEILAFKWEIDKKLQAYQERTEKLITKFKDEILSHIDPVVKELKTAREERTLMGHQLDQHKGKLEDHEERIIHLEATP